ncbi:single-stranded DNA-binding protein [Comamonas piscis]|uniref:Single-stranded DNA-binding protein n=1 Tax=Comamonas piscis TaxID=1562974 RepID=A0A7G5EJL5_9BURK|nr:single-stranded DNA-binding protein [Comamonas piscis]QMV74190.1 single-stranded DNA-binding protein [Comamonas piscis]WSO32630.1 single-stranded DNA-binding protein [Comamonas piscis]
MMDGLVSGRILGQPVERISKTGKPYALAKVRANAGAGDGEMLIVNVIAFDDAPVAALLGLGDADSICLSGSLTPKVWVDREGVTRPSVDMVAHQVLTAYAVARKRGVAGDADFDPAA